MRALCLAVVLSFCAAPLWANARISVLMDVLRIDEVVGILQAEGLAHAEVLNEDMLDGRGGAFWHSQIRQIYTADHISEEIRKALREGLSPEEVESVIAFFDSPQTARIITLENAARRAMADQDVETSAIETYTAAVEEGDAHARLVRQFVEVNDLMERNVSGTMSAHVRFYTGLSDGRYLVQSENAILDQVWARQGEIRESTEDWLNGFLFMAYQPLPIDVLEAHVAFSSSVAGRALNAALFDGFESINLDISYALGRAVALNANGDEI